jgi:K+/H+ antiporter YhaU regulatory subunit KhtT
MKTAMQELIDVLNINETNFISRIDDKITIAYHNVIKKTVASFLEKENQQMIALVQSLKDYTHESHSILGHDEREAAEFVEIFINQP